MIPNVKTNELKRSQNQSVRASLRAKKVIEFAGSPHHIGSLGDVP